MIHQATASDLTALSHLAIQLWPDNTPDALESEFAQLLSDPQAALFLAYSNDTPIGFAQCQLRHDYVEGTESSPVGYLEGIFVSKAYRHMGYARLLLAACEIWAKGNGCQEFASDCEFSNTESLSFHLHAGFTEANRIICFTKHL